MQLTIEQVVMHNSGHRLTASVAYVTTRTWLRLMRQPISSPACLLVSSSKL